MLFWGSVLYKEYLVHGQYILYMVNISCTWSIYLVYGQYILYMVNISEPKTYRILRILTHPIFFIPRVTFKKFTLLSVSPKSIVYCSKVGSFYAE